MDDFICFGHRGAMGHEPENTLRSFRRALELGCTWVELDVHLVGGRLVVFHDHRLERTTNGKGRIAAHSFEHLRTLDAGKGELIPTLDEVFDLVDGKAGINVELKGRGTAEPVAAFLAARRARGWPEGLMLVSSFDHRELRTVKTREPWIGIGALVDGVPLGRASFAVELGAYSVHQSIEFVDRELVEDAHRRGLKVFVYTVNEPEEIEAMRTLGVDGVFSNYPERVLGGSGGVE